MVESGWSFRKTVKTVNRIESFMVRYCAIRCAKHTHLMGRQKRAKNDENARGELLAKG